MIHMNYYSRVNWLRAYSFRIVRNYWTWKLIWNYILLWSYFNSNLPFDKKTKKIPASFGRSYISNFYFSNFYGTSCHWKSRGIYCVYSLEEKSQNSLGFKLEIINWIRRKERGMDFANFAALPSKQQETKVKLIYQRTKAWQKPRRNRGASQKTTFHQSTTTKVTFVLKSAVDGSQQRPLAWSAVSIET